LGCKSTAPSLGQALEQAVHGPVQGKTASIGLRSVALAIVWSLLFGALMGWIGSLVMRTDSSEGILVDIAVGAVGAVASALLFGNFSTFDSVMAGYLGSLAGLALLHLIRRAQANRKADTN
jgi:uncharacterized membrane protein YeaQ/YmgE (transglycosylase-associated protein family)